MNFWRPLIEMNLKKIVHENKLTFSVCFSCSFGSIFIYGKFWFGFFSCHSNLSERFSTNCMLLNPTFFHQDGYLSLIPQSPQFSFLSTCVHTSVCLLVFLRPSTVDFPVFFHFILSLSPGILIHFCFIIQKVMPPKVCLSSTDQLPDCHSNTDNSLSPFEWFIQTWDLIFSNEAMLPSFH